MDFTRLIVAFLICNTNAPKNEFVGIVSESFSKSSEQTISNGIGKVVSSTVTVSSSTYILYNEHKHREEPCRPECLQPLNMSSLDADVDNYVEYKSQCTSTLGSTSRGIE
jgi:hypothetical protein